jgi:hypothetical protein
MNSLKFWNTDGYDIASYKWLLKERADKEILGNGSDTGNCYYSFNELGFRGDSPKKRGIKFMSVGCEHTEGINVHNHQTWPHLVSRMIPNGVDLNLGISGRSNDYIARSILTWTDYFKPALVLIMYTYPHRREFYLDNGNVEPYAPKPWGYFDEEMEGRQMWSNLTYASNQEENLMNWYKNHLLISNYLKLKEIPFIWNGTFVQTEYTDAERFDGDYPYFENTNIHATDYQNEIYAKKLFNHMKENFEM